jgi:hypothetical protein
VLSSHVVSEILIPDQEEEVKTEKVKFRVSKEADANGLFGNADFQPEEIIWAGHPTGFVRCISINVCLLLRTELYQCLNL